MKNSFLILGVIAFLLIMMGWGCSNYNGFVDSEANVENSWSKVQSAYQRRADLIPNLVNTVKGQADFEQSTLTQVVEARANATKINVDASNLTPENMQQFQKAQGQLTSSLSRLLLTVEKYPELKANQGFMELQSQLEGTENRIKVARDAYNDTVTDFNKSVRRFPANFFAGIFGFESKAQFEAQEGSENAPKVSF